MAAVAGGVFTTTRAVEAQLPAGNARIGILLTASPPSDVAFRLRDGVRAGLRQAGYVEGRGVTIEERNAEGNVERLRDLTTELIQLRVVVIVTFGTPAALAAKAATQSIPIVATSVGDPVGSGLIRSLAGPNGNITGVTNFSRELSAKRFQLLTWAGEWVGSGSVGSGKLTITLQQSAASVTGNAVFTGGASSVSGPVTGTVSGDECSISYKGGIANLTVKGNEMSGSSSLSRWTLKRQ